MTSLVYAIVFAVRRRGGTYQLLVARRAEGKYMGGTWQLISGGVEAGEAVWECALRELREETGLVAQELYRLTTVTQFYRPDVDALATGVPFCAIVDGAAEVALNVENTDVEWVDARDAGARLMWPSDQLAFVEIQREILSPAGTLKPHLVVDQVRRSTTVGQRAPSS